jgi:hypothetical protein
MKQRILDVLVVHYGKNQAITVSKIVEMIGEEQTGLTNPVARIAIKEIILDEDLPIGSCSNGYYIIQTKEELNEYISNLHSRICGIKQRIKAVRKAFIKFKLKTKQSS